MNDNGDKEEKTGTESEIVKVLKAGDFPNAFSGIRGSNIADKLVEPGDDPLGISMRTFYGKQTDGRIVATAVAAEWGDLCEFDYEQGKMALLMLLAGLPSDQGRAREDLVNAIIGDKQMKARSGFFDKFKPFADKNEAKT